MKKQLFTVLLLCLTLLFGNVYAEESAGLPEKEYEVTTGGMLIRNYQGKTLRFSIRKISYQNAECYLTKIWMQEPGKQIHKVMADWQTMLRKPINMTEKTDAALVINGSGFFSTAFRDMPDSYPGEDETYFNTSWGTLVLTGGQVYRQLDGQTFTGLGLCSSGLNMYADADLNTVLADGVTDTFAFRDICCIIQNGEITVADDQFSQGSYIRNIIAKTDSNNYILLAVTSKKSNGLSLQACAELLAKYGCEWAFNLDGGPSYALLAKRSPRAKLNIIAGNTTRVIDTMYFTEADGK